MWLRYEDSNVLQDLRLKIIMHNDGESVNVILPHFAYGVHILTICDTLKLRKISNTKTAGFCRSAPRTGVVWAETCAIARNVTAVTARDHKRNAKATRKTTLPSLHTHSRIMDYEMNATHDTYGNEKCLQNSFRYTANKQVFFRSPPSWVDLKLCESVEWIVVVQNRVQKWVL